MKNYVLLFLIITVFSSCAVQSKFSKKLHSSVGKDAMYLRTTYGPPTEILDNANAGEVWLYAEDYLKESRGYISSDNMGNNVYIDAPGTYEGVRTMKFFLNPRGEIYNVRATGYKMKNKAWLYASYILGPIAAIPIILWIGNS